MTQDAFLSRMKSWSETLKLAAFIIGTLWFGIGFAAAVMWSLWNAYDGRAWVREYLGISEMVRRLEGENRVILTREQASFAYSPVSRANPIITAQFSVRRTASGFDCRAVNVVPMFEGSRNIPRAGIMLSPIQQVSTQWTPVEVQAEVPKSLSLGRALMWMVVDYDCPEGRRVDETAAVIFEFTE